MIVEIEIESLLGLAGSPLEMRLCASNHGDQINLTVIITHKQYDTEITLLRNKNIYHTLLQHTLYKTLGEL